MFILILDLVEDFHTVEERRLHRIFCGLTLYYSSLIDAVDAAEDGDTVTLLKDDTVSTDESTGYVMPENSILDLGGHTLTVPYMTAIFEGTNITIQNGRFESTADYAIWIGNGENVTTATLKNITSNGGVNVYVAQAVLENCDIDASAKTYYAVWGDNGDVEITIKSGTYIGGTCGAVVNASDGYYEEEYDPNPAKITIQGGNFTGEVWTQNRGYGVTGLVSITGGTFSADPTEYVADGHAVFETSGGTYTVEKLTAANSEAKIGDKYYLTLKDAVAAAEDGNTVKLLKDVTVGNSENKTNFWISKSIILDLNTNTLTGAYQLAVGVNNVDADVTVKNGTLVGGPYYCAYLVNGKLTLDGITIDYSVERPVQLAETGTGKTLIVKNSAIRSTGEKQFGIMSFDINNKIVIENSTVSADYWAVYHNGSYRAFELTAENSTLTSESAQGIYISGSTITTAAAGKNQKATFTNCTITGATGIEGKYTDITLDNCTVTATLEEPEFVQNNNGSTANGFSVVSTDNSMSPSSPAPTAVVTINGGRYTGPVGLIQFIDHETYPDFKEATYIVTGGTFSTNPRDYVAEGISVNLTPDGRYMVGAYPITIVDPNNDPWVDAPAIYVDIEGAVTGVQAADVIGKSFDVPANTALPYWRYVGWTFTATDKDGKTETFATVTTLTQELADWLAAKIEAGGWTFKMDSKTPGIYTPSSGGGSSSGGSSTTTEKNPDGSTTTTTTDKTTGTVTEVTKDKDGTTTTVETKKDGTVTETVKTAEGVTGTVVTDKYGDVTEAKATVSTTAAKEAAKTGEAVTLPVEVPAVKTTEEAPALQVTVPKSADSVKVEIPVEKVTPGTVAVIVNADGTEKIVSTSVVTENGVALTLDGNATVKIIDNSKSFTDVPANSVFYNEISSLSAREIMVGKTDDKFDLHSSVTLDQIANVAGRITGAVDVKDFHAGVSWGADNGLKTGSVAATRGDVLKALYIAAGSPVVEDTSILSIFNDSSAIPADMAAIAAWAAQNGILKGGLDGNASLGVNVTRGQACALAGRTMGTLD